MADSFINKLTENIRLNPEDYCIFDMYDNVLNVFNSEKISYATLANQLSSLIYDKVNTEFVHISGDRLTGFLTLHQHPISSMHAATKSYVDNLSASFRSLLSGLSSDISRGSLKSAVSSITIASPNNTLTITNPTISSSSGTINIDVNSVPLDKLGSGGAYGGQVLVFDQSTQTYVPSSISTSGGGGGGGTIVNNVDNTPIGTINYFAASAAPVGYLECDGAIVKKSDYVDLYAVIKDTYTTVLSAGHFKLPDLRGEFVRGWDNGRNVNTGRVFGSNESDELKSHQHQLPLNPNNHAFATGGEDGGEGTSNYSNASLTNFTGGTETRPRNVALLPCIKALRTVTGPTSVVQINSVNSFTINGSMLAKAWVNFNGTKDTTGTNSTSNTNRLINASYNVDSVSRTAEGKYTINFKAGTFDNPNYTYAIGVALDAPMGITYSANVIQLGSKTTSSIQIESDKGGSYGTKSDISEVCFTFYASGGDLTGSANVFDSTPVGTINYFAASAAPVGYLECNGAAVSKSDYSDLFSVIGNTYTSVLSANHFRVPDLRGEFIRGWDDGRGVDAGRTLGSWQKGSIHNVGAGPTADTVCDYNVNQGTQGRTDSGYDLVDDLSIYPNFLFTNSGSPNQAGAPLNTEMFYGTTRPRNVAFMPCIKAQKTVTGTTQTLNFIEKPASATNGQVLTYNASTNRWEAGAAPNPIANIQAYVSFDGTRDSSGTTNSSNTNRFIYSSNNVSSVLKNSTGTYTITFANSFANSNYIASGTTNYIPPGLGIDTKTSTNCTIVTYQQGPGYYDTSIVDVCIIK